MEELLDQGYIKECMSPWAILVLLVPKKNGLWWMCIDYKEVNNITIKYRHPIPRFDDMWNELHGFYVFSKTDLKSGYHQMYMHAGDEWK